MEKIFKTFVSDYCNKGIKGHSNYDRMELAVPRGMKARIKEIAKEHGYSQNNYILEAVKEKYKNDTGKELTWKRED